MPLLFWNFDEIDRLCAEKELTSFESIRWAFEKKKFSSAMSVKTLENLFKWPEKRPKGSRREYVEQIANLLGVTWSSIVKAGTDVAAAEVSAIRPCRMHILRPVDMPYSNDIVFAFLGELYKRCADKISVETHIAIPGCVSEYSGKNRENHLEYSKHVIQRQREDHSSIIVAIGTSAILALRDCLGDNFGMTPIIFLGCTLPNHKDHRFVMSMSQRTEKRQVAGVPYNTDMRSLFAYLNNELLEGSELGLGYFHRTGLEMDRYVRDEFYYAKSVICDRALHEVQTKKLPRISDLDEKSVYFGWQTADELFLDPDHRETLNKRMIISPTRRYVEYGLSAIGYQADEMEIGQYGANLLIDYLSGTRSLGTFNIESTPLRLWVHAGKLQEWERNFGFELPEKIRNDPDTVWYGR